MYTVCIRLTIYTVIPFSVTGQQKRAADGTVCSSGHTLIYNTHTHRRKFPGAGQMNQKKIPKMENGFEKNFAKLVDDDFMAYRYSRVSHYVHG